MITDTDRLEWCFKFCSAKTIGGVFDGPGNDFVYVPIKNREQIDMQIAKERKRIRQEHKRCIRDMFKPGKHSVIDAHTG